MTQSSSRSGLVRILHHHGLSMVLFAAFIIFWIAQAIAGWKTYNGEQKAHREAPLSFAEYLTTGDFVEATAENWESEFLQMAAFVWLTSFLFQKGSPESNDPDKPESETPTQPDSPWPVHRGGFALAIYARSLTLAFVLMFLISFAVHAMGGAAAYSEERQQHGEASVSTIQYLGTSRFWFESFENWQSEFLAIFMMVVLSIFLRQRNSPESKDVATPHWEHE